MAMILRCPQDTRDGLFRHKGEPGPKGSPDGRALLPHPDCPKFRGTPYNENSLLDEEEYDVDAYTPQSSQETAPAYTAR